MTLNNDHNDHKDDNDDCAERFGVRPLAAAFISIKLAKKSGRKRPHSKVLRAKKKALACEQRS